MDNTVDLRGGRLTAAVNRGRKGLVGGWWYRRGVDSGGDFFDGVWWFVGAEGFCSEV